MEIREVDELVNWVKCNVLDMPKTSDVAAFETRDFRANVAPVLMEDETIDPAADETEWRPTLADRNTPAEYDFPLSLLEHILGLDRVQD